MLDAIVSNKTFGNATFRQFVIRGFQNFRGLLFAACSSEKSPPPAVATPSVSPIPMPTESFSAKFPNGTGGRGGRFFSATGDLPPQPERVHSPAKDAF